MTDTIWVLTQVTYKNSRDKNGFVTAAGLTCSVQTAYYIGYYTSLSEAEEMCAALNKDLYNMTENLEPSIPKDMDLLCQLIMQDERLPSVTYHHPTPIYKRTSNDS